MEDCQAVESPFFNGSIREAIGVAKSEKKNLIIYIAEDNEDCQNMHQTTWQDFKVRKALLEQFVTLHLWHRSTDAAHFAAMFPYSTVPCISFISHTGVLLKRLGGYTSPTDLLGTLEQSITMQNTAALVAALASANNGSTTIPREIQANRASNEPECFESAKAGSSAMNNDSDTLHTAAAAASTATSLDNENNQPEHLVSLAISSNSDTLYTTTAAANSTTPQDDDTSQPEQLASAQMHVQAGMAFSETKQDIIKSQMHIKAVGALPNVSEDRRRPEIDSDTCDVLSDALLSESNTASRALDTVSKNPLVSIDTSAESVEQKVVPPQSMEVVSKTKQIAEAFLIQVRLTNGRSIRKSFNPKDCLAAVKEFVDENRDDGNAAYSLGMLYPRKVFDEEDMPKSLLELSLDNRANLILVTSTIQQTAPAPERTSTSAETLETTNVGISSGLWKIFSYLNPLSYFSGNSSNTNNSESGSSGWQYEPDPNVRNSLRQGSESHGSLTPDVNEANTSKRKKAPQGRNWGGNVHTLQHNDDDEAFKRGNAFWNGNSTQYGGDDSKK